MWAAGWLLLTCILAPNAGQAADPSALWKIVNGQCVPHQEAEQNPSPCSLVDLAQGKQKGFALLKDIRGIAQFLLIPTARISGIEDPAILEPNETNYWEPAWQGRSLVEARLHAALPRDAVSLAINSAYGRTQDQLHIHIDCVRPDVRERLGANLDKIGDHWSEFPFSLAGHSYRSIRINQESLAGANPFLILADAAPVIRTEMGTHTLVVIGATFSDNRPGFVLLDDKVDLAAGDRASGESLQDHSCAVAAQ